MSELNRIINFLLMRSYWLILQREEYQAFLVWVIHKNNQCNRNPDANQDSCQGGGAQFGFRSIDRWELEVGDIPCTCACILIQTELYSK